jgi:hypothetical protein
VFCAGAKSSRRAFRRPAGLSKHPLTRGGGRVFQKLADHAELSDFSAVQVDKIESDPPVFCDYTELAIQTDAYQIFTMSPPSSQVDYQ